MISKQKEIFNEPADERLEEITDLDKKLDSDDLTHFRPMFPFYVPLKYQKTLGFLVFSGVIKWEHWPEMV